MMNRLLQVSVVGRVCVQNSADPAAGSWYEGSRA